MEQVASLMNLFPPIPRSCALGLVWFMGFAGGKALPPALAASAAPPELRVVVPETGLVSLGYPRVFAQLYENGRPKVGAPASPVLQHLQTVAEDWADLNLAELEGPHTWFTAVLDTGASGHLLTRSTVERFGILALPGVYIVHEAKFSSFTTPISVPYGLTLAGSQGNLGEAPSGPFTRVQPAAQFAYDLRPQNPAQLIQLGGINLIGMPAIRGHLIEIDPSNLRPRKQTLRVPENPAELRAFYTNSAGPIVRIHRTGSMPTNGVLRLPLRYIDLSSVQRTLAGNRSPTRSENPVLMGARAWSGDRWFIGNWLLDTGAEMSFISRRQALALGWTPQAAESLSATNLTIQDVTGEKRWRMAMRLDKLEFRNPGNQILEFRDATVLVQDVSFTQPNGNEFQLDGLIGLNLLLPSLRDLNADGGGKFVGGPFKRIFLDGYRAELGVEPHEWPEPTSPPAATNAVRWRPGLPIRRPLPRGAPPRSSPTNQVR